MPVEVKMRKGETIDKALRRLKKKLDREQIIIDAREKRYFVPPCEKRQLRVKRLKFQDMLKRRYANM